MKILSFFKQGLKTTNKRWKMVIYLWLINFIFSILMITPFYFLLRQEFSHSLMGDRVYHGFDLLWFGDLAFKYKSFYTPLLGWLLVPGLFYLLFFVFLNGGILGRIAASEEELSFKNFLADCSQYFFRFFRVFLLSIVGYLLVLVLLFRVISAFFSLWTKNAPSEWPLIYASNFKFLIAILLFSIVRMFFDYVRVRLVVEGSKKTIRATILNFSFLGRRFFRAWALYLLVGVVVVILGLVYLGLWRFFPQSGVFLIGFFIIQQLYLLSRMWTRLLFFSTEYHFFKTD